MINLQAAREDKPSLDITKVIYKLFSIVKNILTLGLTLFILLFVAYSVISHFNYVDLQSLCYIKVKAFVTSDTKETISEAITYIQNSNPTEYKTVCKYVDTIMEKPCISAEENSPEINFIDTDGCYIRGSKVIHVVPADVFEADIVINRANTIITYAKESESFWNASGFESGGLFDYSDFFQKIRSPNITFGF